MRKLTIGIYVLYILIITYLSLTPTEHKVLESLNLWDKASHFIAYMILFIIVKKVHTKSNYLTCAIICFVYSFILECIQHFIPNRYFDILDLLANALGAVLGVIIYYLLIEKFFQQESKNNIAALKMK